MSVYPGFIVILCSREVEIITSTYRIPYWYVLYCIGQQMLGLALTVIPEMSFLRCLFSTFSTIIRLCGRRLDARNYPKMAYFNFPSHWWFSFVFSKLWLSLSQYSNATPFGLWIQSRSQYWKLPILFLYFTFVTNIVDLSFFDDVNGCVIGWSIFDRSRFHKRVALLVANTPHGRTMTAPSYICKTDTTHTETQTHLTLNPFSRH